MIALTRVNGQPVSAVIIDMLKLATGLERQALDYRTQGVKDLQSALEDVEAGCFEHWVFAVFGGMATGEAAVSSLFNCNFLLLCSAIGAMSYFVLRRGQSWE